MPAHVIMSGNATAPMAVNKKCCCVAGPSSSKSNCSPDEPTRCWLISRAPLTPVGVCPRGLLKMRRTMRPTTQGLTSTAALNCCDICDICQMWNPKCSGQCCMAMCGGAVGACGGGTCRVAGIGLREGVDTAGGR